MDLIGLLIIGVMFYVLMVKLPKKFAKETSSARVVARKMEEEILYSTPYDCWSLGEGPGREPEERYRGKQKPNKETVPI